MNQKSFTIIKIVVIGAIILAGVVGYLILNQQKPLALSSTELKYRIEEKLGKATFCGPPAVSDNYETELLEQFPMLVANTEEFKVILKQTKIVDKGSFSNQDKLALVKEYNRLSAIELRELNGKYQFSMLSLPDDRKEGFLFEGSITKAGAIAITKKEDYPYGCPV